MTPAEIDEAAETLAPLARKAMIEVAERQLAEDGWTPAQIAQWRPRFERQCDEGLVRKIAVTIARNYTRH